MRIPHFTVLLFSIAISVIGLFLIPYLHLNFTPQSVKDNLQVYYSYPNSNPRQLEETLTAPIEASLSLLDGITSISSVSSYGTGYISAILDKSANPDFVRYEVSNKLRILYPNLPEEVPFPVIRLNDSDKQAIDPVILSYSLIASEERSKILEYARDQLIPIFSQIQMLEKVDISGAEQEEWLIKYSPDLLSQYGLTISNIQDAIESLLYEANLGFHRKGDEYMYVRLQPHSIERILNHQVVIADQPFPLSDIITVQKTESLPLQYYRINGKNSIRLNFIPQSNANQLELAAQIKKQIKRTEDLLHNRYKLEIDFDRTKYIRDELIKIKTRSIWSISILLCFVVLVYRKWQDIIIVMLSLGINLSSSLILYYLLDIQLDLYALAAITISFGIIIDNTIVMSHHYQRHQDFLVFRPILTATLTTLSAMLVIFYLPEKLQLQLSEFAKVLSINLGVSLLVCLIVVPSLIEYMLIPTSKISLRHGILKRFILKINRSYYNIISIIRKFRIPAIIGLVLLFGLPVFLLPSKWNNHKWYNDTFGSEHYVNNLKPWINQGLGGSLRLFNLYVYENSGFRSPEETQLFVNSRLPDGSSIEQMNELIGKIEQYLDRYEKEISTFRTRISSGQRASIVITFREPFDPSFPHLLKNRIQSYAVDLGGASWSIYGIGKAFSNAHGGGTPRFMVLLKGYNKDLLNDQSEILADTLLRHSRIQEIENDASINLWEKEKYQYHLKIDNESIAMAGINMTGIRRLLSHYHQGRTRLATDPYNIPIKIAPFSPNKYDLWKLKNSIHGFDALAIKFDEMTQFEKIKKSNSIHKKNQQYIQQLEFDYSGYGRFGQIYLEKCLDAFRPILPLGYTADQASGNFGGKEEKKKYHLLGLVVIAIFFICSIHFESLKLSLLIISLIPLSFIGIFLTFYWFDFPFDQGGYTSFLLVSGLVVNALVIIFSDYVRFKRSWPHRKSIDLYLRAFRNKSTPIYLTIISTILGLIPFTMHGSQEVFWFALAVGTIGGLIFSLFILVFAIPLFVTKNK